MNAFPVRDVAAVRHGDDITESDTEVFAYDLVHTDGRVVTGFIGQNDTDGIPALLTLDEDRVAPKEGQFFHLRWGETDDGIIIVRGIIHDKTVG